MELIREQQSDYTVSRILVFEDNKENKKQLLHIISNAGHARESWPHKRAFDFRPARDLKNKRFIPCREIHQRRVITRHSLITQDSQPDNKTTGCCCPSFGPSTMLCVVNFSIFQCEVIALAGRGRLGNGS